MVKQNDVLKFNAVADYTVSPNQSTASDEGTVSHLCLRADDARRSQIGSREYFCCLMNPDVFTDFIVFFLIKALSQFNDEVFDSL